MPHEYSDKNGNPLVAGRLYKDNLQSKLAVYFVNESGLPLDQNNSPPDQEDNSLELIMNPKGLLNLLGYEISELQETKDFIEKHSK